MPLQWTGQVTLHIVGTMEKAVVRGRDLELIQAGLRIIDDDEVRHEFVYRYDDPWFELVINAAVEKSVVEIDSLLLNAKAEVKVEEQANTLAATFHHDPDIDDEPLTPVSSN
ncbi:hypothetical protein [Vreelandella populi]|uniref:hypothetical protein n=1 Tax=Vreelandella populi TaxID=2498858 RepID=UPI000F8C3512|nr:hypothetical protein [Halomonas populi]RUR51646.1 hypothetical protein ELY40_17820 [Halomonas populi]